MIGELALDTRTHRVLAGASRVRVLQFLRDAPEPSTASDVAQRVGLHPNTVRLHLDQLVSAGLVERTTEHRAGPGRPRLLFAARPAPTGTGSEDGESYRTLAGILAGQLAQRSAAPEEAARAGAAWARSLPQELRGSAPATAERATGQLVDLMDRLGFAPSSPATGEPIELHRCPFGEVAAQHPDVVCGVHLGLIESVLEDLDAPLRAARLEPFAAPGICRAHLEPVRTTTERAPS